MIRFQSNKSMTSEEVTSPLFFSASSSTNPRRPVQHKVDRPMRVLGYRTPAEPFADEPPNLQA